MTTTEHPQTGTIIEPGIWTIDASHSTVGFVARHLMVSKVRGRFGSVEGTITIADDPFESSVRATVDAASVDSGDAKRDEHLRSADFFDVEQYPTIEFVSTKVEDRGDGTYALTGDLTDRKSTRLNSSHVEISYAVFCLKKKTKKNQT